MLPGVDHILEIIRASISMGNIPKTVAVKSIRRIIDRLRAEIIGNKTGLVDDDLKDSRIVERVMADIEVEMTPNLARVINGTGVVIHTNLGRSILPKEALDNIADISGNYSNLEFDLSIGGRGSRYSCVEALLCDMTGSESAMVVNNNAAAVLLCLETMARGRQVVVSRGELVEIGGSFRIPDVMAKSGGILKEVGTTNRTHARDYEETVGEDVALFLKVHTSNYSLVGFTSEVPLKELVALGAAADIPVMEDLGSGTLIDFSEWGLPKEPTVQESVATGADIVTFSGDKLLGGPQAGIIVGKKKILDKIKKNPLTRALRIDKLTLGALESTLRLYRDPKKAVDAIPTLNMLTLSMDQIEKKASGILKILEEIDDKRLHLVVVNGFSKPGGGSLPLLKLPSRCVGIKISGISANRIERQMRLFPTPVIGRIENEMFILDVRTIRDDEPIVIKKALSDILNRQ